MIDNPSSNDVSFSRNGAPLDVGGSLSDDLRRYLAIIWHWAWLLVLLSAIGAGYGYWQSTQRVPVYRSSATLLIIESRNLNEYANILASERLAQTYSKLMIQVPVLEGVVESLGLDISPGSLRGKIEVEVVQDTQLINVYVTDTDPQRASDIANTIGLVFSEQNQKLQSSRFTDSKENLSTQLTSVDTQIQEVNRLLDSLGQETGKTLEQTQLETKLAAYRTVYESLLEQKALAEIQTLAVDGTSGQDGVTLLEAQIKEVEEKIRSNSTAQDALGPLTLDEPPAVALERDRLLTLAAAYTEIRRDLLSQLAEEQIYATPASALATPVSLDWQIDQLEQQILETDQALRGMGISANSNLERDKLETQLALYQQIYSNLLQSFEQVRLAEIQNTTSVVVSEQASPSGSPTNLSGSRDMLLSAVVGLMLGLGIVVLIELLDDTVKGPEDVMRHLGLSVLGLIAKIENEAESNEPIASLEPRSPLAEAFRSLRTNIQYSSVDRPLRTLLVTSPSPKDGKSTIVTNLGVVLAQSGRKVIILDADMRRPAVHKRFGMSNRQGLSDLFVQQEVVLDGLMKETKVPDLRILPTGGLPPNPAELVGSHKMTEILHTVGEQTNMILVDSPPVMAVTDAAVMAPQVDGVVLVVRPGATKLAAARQAVEQLRRSNANLLGVVLNDVENKRTRYYYYYKGYYSYTYHYYGEQGRSKKGLRRKNK